MQTKEGVDGFVLPEKECEGESVCDVRETRRRKEPSVRLKRGVHQRHVRKQKILFWPHLPLLFCKYTFKPFGVLMDQSIYIIFVQSSRSVKEDFAFEP